jgi:hypothetical protein
MLVTLPYYVVPLNVYSAAAIAYLDLSSSASLLNILCFALYTSHAFFFQFSKMQAGQKPHAVASRDAMVSNFRRKDYMFWFDAKGRE